ncbi:bifunctional (p)ppGpp synthetase/guanosine-3',5'-bis(diphosphate) 3'-pyrophosphohydrolase [Paludibacter sp. 221]|uniref:RelA/SpoT family protein n=1 Tax=Paludibacter sp. 221 TaxID=2302939 RepID=UPI0013D784FE|nr:RelA/SpoT family protein [Paludibacter sp. 221]NDV46159.1 bifunctional (p)ppGpp synthetase/guanosine-3',5'-bis(diphosphate) 3'-pyrophosphohydrolase [Paludibacter sp. 221]
MTLTPAATSIRKKYNQLLRLHPNLFTPAERLTLKNILVEHYASEKEQNLAPGRSIFDRIHIVGIVLDEIGLGKPAVLSVLLHEMTEKGKISVKEINQRFNTSVDSIIHGLSHVENLYKRNASIETENFRKLLLTFAEDIRVILIMVAERLYVMRNLDAYPEEIRQGIARECSFLYAPLAHRMGLYAIKSELEDLSLKYTNREIYKEIAKKLNETKRSREKYIAEFITPLKEKLNTLGITFDIKGRTKSIHSIYSKIKKQNTAFENIYDLFAIRIIIDAPIEKEKAVCWQAYSIVTDMYQPNPKRLRDWISIPKSNGYESLHTTVLGPEEKWVEVQIRTRRMDEIAEKGLAAHWKYKGIKSESGMDEWLKNIREILENPELNAVDFMDEFKLNLYDKEVFVFTPNGDLHKLPKGATVLDFAFSIHSELGSKCVGAKVNNKNVPIKHVLDNGDQVQILTSPTQKPNQAWLGIVTTSKAKNKIRQALKEVEFKDAEIGRETLIRRFKNWKIELDDGNISRLAKKKGYKTVSDLYQELAQGKLDILLIKDAYLNLDKRDTIQEPEVKSAESFSKEPQQVDVKEDVLIIGQDLKNVDFKLSKCCNPIYGDDVFGFVSVTGGIKIHRTDCPNAPQLISRFGYRIIKARWSGKSVGSLYPITLRIVGHDDIGIVANITSLISKEKNIQLRSISIDSNAGLFQGNITLMVNDTKDLEAIVKKIKLVKGVKNVSRA